jgi:hypothetical protein
MARSQNLYFLMFSVGNKTVGKIQTNGAGTENRSEWVRCQKKSTSIPFLIQRKIQCIYLHGTTVATIHDTGQEDTLGHGCHQHVKYVIITKDTRLRIIDGAQGFVLAILFITIIIGDRTTVTCK